MTIDELYQLATVALHTFIIYLFLIFALSLLGHRQSAELSITELVVIMIIGSSVETAMVAGNTALLAGIVSATTLMVSNRGLSLLMGRWPQIRRFVIGRAILLVYNGRMLLNHLDEAGLDEDDVREGLRERGYDDLASVRMAVLEIDGTISVIPREQVDKK